MDAVEVMKLFDSCWFDLQILKAKSNFEANPDHKIEFQENPSKTSGNSQILTLHRRSMSDQLSSQKSFRNDSLSPDSVLCPPKLHTIPSGKEINELNEIKIESISSPKRNIGARRKQKGGSKSYSHLEFEELKGFMDLGFIFSEADNKDSNLVSIVPGLQRLGKKNGGEEGNDDNELNVSRPYLSEAWQVMEERRKKEKPLMNWRIPEFSNEIDMKDNLRWWAHTVASTVR